MSEAEVICQRMGRCGVVTLNRPKALNALTLNMVRLIAAALDAWETDPEISCVAIRGAGERAFCAGGDIKRLCELGKAGDYAAQLAFWREEYQLNYRIKTYPKPFVALIHGIVMGGGAGVGIHAHHAVATETFSFAMPEVGIGFFPDIGASYFLPRLAGRVGFYLALTGNRIGLGEALAFGLVEAYVPAVKLEALLLRLISGEAVKAAIAAEAMPGPESTLKAESDFIAASFADQDIAAVVAKVKAAADAGSSFAMETRETILSKSPTSLAIALKQMHLGSNLDLAENLRMDLRIVARIAQGHDFYEGVRATLIDKDSLPKWHPGTIEALKAGDIEAYFASLGEDELTFPAQKSAA
jgi:enoyl-CoA hydratase